MAKHREVLEQARCDVQQSPQNRYQECLVRDEKREARRVAMLGLHLHRQPQMRYRMDWERRLYTNWWDGGDIDHYVVTADGTVRCADEVHNPKTELRNIRLDGTGYQRINHDTLHEDVEHWKRHGGWW